MTKRVFLIVLDSFGIGGAQDAAEFGDAGSDTLAALRTSAVLQVPNLAGLGLFSIDGVPPDTRYGRSVPGGAFARLAERSRGKDTTIGHWEIAGVVSEKPLPTFPEGFPAELLEAFSNETGRGVLCNRPYSGTEVIRDYGGQQLKTGEWIVYTSADSVFQLAANEDVIPLEELYTACQTARRLLTGELAVGRVIARPFVGDSAQHFRRTANRHDYSLPPPAPTVLDALQDSGREVIGVGKIRDIFAGQGITCTLASKSNDEGMACADRLLQEDFEGLAFINLVDFDMLYGHRNDVDGYAAALSRFDDWLGGFLPRMHADDVLMITADHGCDPSTPSTDHSRENVPLLMAGSGIARGANLGTESGFSCVANTIAQAFGLPAAYPGRGFWEQVKK